MAKTMDRFRVAILVIKFGRAVGSSKCLFLNEDELVEFCRPLFELFDIKLPRKLSNICQLRRLEQLLPKLQLLAVALMNVLRFHEDALEIAKYIRKIRYTRGKCELCNDAIDWAEKTLKDCIEAFGLDENLFPTRKAEQCQCALERFQETNLRVILVDSIEDFKRVTTPRVAKIDIGSVRAASKAFKSMFNEPKIMVLY